MNKNVNRTAQAVALLLTIAAVAGCGQKGAGGGGGGGRAGGQGGPNQRIPVQVTTVKLGTIADSVPVTGSIQALQDVQIAAKTTARVTQVTVREGDVVRAGQLVVQQDATDLISNVQQAQASVQASLFIL